MGDLGEPGNPTEALERLAHGAEPIENLLPENKFLDINGNPIQPKRFYVRVVEEREYGILNAICYVRAVSETGVIIDFITSRDPSRHSHNVTDTPGYKPYDSARGLMYELSRKASWIKERLSDSE